MGHVRDLPKSKLGVDIEEGFEPSYEVIASRKKVLKELKDAAKEADTIYMATDPDREGEAIGWHLAEELGRGERKEDPPADVQRDHEEGRAFRARASHRDQQADGRRAAGPPRPRPPGRLQDQPAPLGQGPPWSERRPGAVRRPEAGLRSRGGDRPVRLRGVPGTSGRGWPARSRPSSTPSCSSGTARTSRSRTRKKRTRRSRICGARCGPSTGSPPRSARRARCRPSSPASCSRRHGSRSRRR